MIYCEISGNEGKKTSQSGRNGEENITKWEKWGRHIFPNLRGRYFFC